MPGTYYAAKTMGLFEPSGGDINWFLVIIIIASVFLIPVLIGIIGTIICNRKNLS